MNAAELLANLKATPAQLSEWIRQGLPVSKRGRLRDFDLLAVTVWAFGQLASLSERSAPDGTLATVDAVSAHFSTNRRTAHEWKAAWQADGLPWADGPYPIVAIETWRRMRDIAKGVDEQRRIMSVNAARAEWRFKQEQGLMIDVQVPAVIVSRVLTLQMNILENFPDRIASRLPDQMTPEAWPQLKDSIATGCRELVEDVTGKMQAGLKELESEIGGAK